MRWAALIAWVLTAGGGFTLLAVWLRHGGLAQKDQPGQRIRPPLIFAHMALAAGGLVVWIAYLAADEDVLAWIAFGALVPVALLGFWPSGSSDAGVPPRSLAAADRLTPLRRGLPSSASPCRSSSVTASWRSPPSFWSS